MTLYFTLWISLILPVISHIVGGLLLWKYKPGTGYVYDFLLDWTSAPERSIKSSLIFGGKLFFYTGMIELILFMPILYVTIPDNVLIGVLVTTCTLLLTNVVITIIICKKCREDHEYSRV